MPKKLTSPVQLPIFFAFSRYFRWTGPFFGTILHIRKRFFLDLPCDWRFLPKLGPLCDAARGPFSLILKSNQAVTLFSFV
jgi:hypothetical protein